MRHAAAILAAGVLLAGCAGSQVWKRTGPGGSLTVEVRPDGDRARVSTGARSDGSFDSVALRSVRFSPDGRHAAYAAFANGWTVVRDGVPGARWERVGSLTFSPDGEHLAYAAWDGSLWRVVLDGTASASGYDSVAAEFAFAPGGAGFGFVGWSSGQARAVIRGREGLPYDVVRPIHFSADGARSAYAARTLQSAFIVLDGSEGARHSDVGDIAFRPDGRSLSYAFSDDGVLWRVREWDGATEEHPYVRGLGYCGEEDSVPCYVASLHGRECFVRNGIPGPEYDRIGSIAREAGGRHWGYIGKGGGSSSVVVDGHVVAREPKAVNLALAKGANGAPRYAYIAERGESVYVVDDRCVHSFDLILSGSLVFANERPRWACITGDRRHRKLYITAEDVRRPLALEWSDLVLLSRDGGDGGSGAAWVEAQAKRLWDRPSP